MKDLVVFRKIQSQLTNLHEEYDKLSKKSPNDAVNKFKLRITNEILDQANTILDPSYLPLNFRNFDEDAMPLNSDVVLVLSQYISAFEREDKDMQYYMRKER